MNFLYCSHVFLIPKFLSSVFSIFIETIYKVIVIQNHMASCISFSLLFHWSLLLRGVNFLNFLPFEDSRSLLHLLFLGCLHSLILWYFMHWFHYVNNLVRILNGLQCNCINVPFFFHFKSKRIIDYLSNKIIK